MATVQPSAKEWARIEEMLSIINWPVFLDCDGYLVRLRLQHVGKMKLGIAPYVNNDIKGEWMTSEKDSEEAKRFFPLRTKPLYRGKSRAVIRESYGKKESERSYQHRHPWWSSFKSLKSHLVASNKEIRVLTFQEGTEREKSILLKEES